MIEVLVLRRTSRSSLPARPGRSANGSRSRTGHSPSPSPSASQPIRAGSEVKAPLPARPAAPGSQARTAPGTNSRTTRRASGHPAPWPTPWRGRTGPRTHDRFPRAARASASSRVDCPEPFSPTKKVTGLLRSTVPRDRITGTVNGNRPRSEALVDFGARLSRCGMA